MSLVWVVDASEVALGIRFSRRFKRFENGEKEIEVQEQEAQLFCIFWEVKGVNT